MAVLLLLDSFCAFQQTLGMLPFSRHVEDWVEEIHMPVNVGHSTFFYHILHEEDSAADILAKKVANMPF